MQSSLTTKEHQALKEQAHHLQPIVMIGNKGLTTTLLQEIETSLTAHELIKVRALSEDRFERAALFDQLCATIKAEPIQRIGKILVLWRANEQTKQAPK